MKQANSLLKRLATFKDLPADEQAEILKEVAEDATLRQRFEEYRRQDQLLGRLPNAKPDSRLREDVYGEIRKREADRWPSVADAVSRALIAGGRFAVAVAGLLLIVAVALMFRGQLLVNNGPEQGAIGRPQPSATPTPVLPEEAALVTAGPVELPPTATFAPYPPSQPLPTPTLEPYPGVPTGAQAAPPLTAGGPVSPVYGPLQMQLDGWSAGGRFLAFWQYQVADIAANRQFPSGTLSFYEPASGRVCTYPRELYSGEDGARARHSWLDDERLLVFTNDGGYTIGTVCADDVAERRGATPYAVDEVVARHAGDAWLLLAGGRYFISRLEGAELIFIDVRDVSATPTDAATFSPEGDRIAIHRATGGTAIVDVGTGELMDSFEWSSAGGLGDVFPPQWLANGASILVRSSAEDGALLWPTGGVPEPVGATLLGHEISPGLVGEGATLSDGSDALVMYYLPGSEQYREGVWYYTSSEQTAQQLPFDRATLTDNGERVLFFNDSDGAAGSQNEVWWADTGISPLAPQLLYEGADFPYTAHASDDNDVAIVAGQQLVILDSEGHTTTYELSDVTYGGVPLWSPDGQFVATAGGYAGRPENLLYVIPVR